MPWLATCSSSPLARFGSTAKEYWDKIQVELHGSFPPDHVRRFNEYTARTSAWRALLVCLWTPVPSIVVAIVVELISLENWQTHSARESPAFWFRSFIMLVIVSISYLEQFRQHIPSLRLSRWSVVFIALVGSAFADGVAFLLADNIAYPLPFAANVMALAGVPVLIVPLWFMIREQLRANPQLGRDLRRHLIVCGCQMSMIIIYPIYNSIFVRVSSWAQTALVFVLPMLKLACNNWISHWIASSDEARAESVIFNVEVFHALYVSFSMQSSSAIQTVAAFMGIDFVKAWLSFHEVLKAVNAIEPVSVRPTVAVADARRRVELDEENTPALIKVKASGATLQAMVTSAKVHPPTRLSDVIKNKSQNAVRLPGLVGTSSQSENYSTGSSPTRLRRSHKVLFITEFVALVEYTEVLMPCIFNMYMVIAYCLSNRQYYNILRDLTPDELRHKINSVFLYASLEFASLVVMGIVLWKKLRLSLLHQLAFVLETRQASIQAKVVMWAVTVLQNQVQHTGVDYSFQFAWLKAKQTL